MAAHHHHDHAGSHDHVSAPTGRLLAAAGLNSGFAVVQVAVGLALGSVVVLADAAHQVVDAVGLLTALAAARLAARPASSDMSYGWGKADALGGFVSGILLLASIAWIGYESVQRLFDPVDVDGGGVIVIGLIAIAVNGLSVIALTGRGFDGLALRAARLHLLTDLAGSFLVVAAGAILAGTASNWVDPAASLLLCGVVLRATVGLLRSAADELLDRSPAGLSVEAISAFLERQPGVDRVHHVHVRPLGQARSSVTAHVVVSGESSVHDAQDQIGALSTALRQELDIAHSTLQVECHPCRDEDC